MTNHTINVCGHGLLICSNPDGGIAWRRPFKNGVTAAGLRYLAGVGFAQVSQVMNWYVGLIDNSGFSSLNSADTPSSHSGWSEFTSYSGNRPTWQTSLSGGVVSTSTVFTYSVTASGIIKGMFVVSDNTRGGTIGTLWAHALLPAVATVSPGQTVTGTYSIQVVAS